MKPSLTEAIKTLRTIAVEQDELLVSIAPAANESAVVILLGTKTDAAGNITEYVTGYVGLSDLERSLERRKISWYWGNYFSVYQDAVADFNKRSTPIEA